MAPPSFTEVELIAAPLTFLLYGVFLVLALSSMYFSVTRQRQSNTLNGRKLNEGIWTPMFIGSIVILILQTGHLIPFIYRYLQAFIWMNKGTTPELFFTDLSQPSYLAQFDFGILCIHFGDAMIIYRLWIIWGRKKSVIFFPVLALIALFTFGITLVFTLSRFYPGETIFASSAGRWVNSKCALTLAINFYCTFMIAYKVSKVVKSTQSWVHSSGVLLTSLAIFIESAALYTFWTLFFIISYQLRTSIQNLAFDTWVVSSGISFMLINVRVGLGWAHQALTQDTTMPQFGSMSTGVQSSRGYRARPMAVEISRTVEFDETKSGYDHKDIIPMTPV